VAPATMSFHFKTLDHAGLIKSRQAGRFVYYATNFKVMNEMVAYLTENCCGGNKALCVMPVPADTGLEIEQI
jgi:predicted transcriptional regulator